jgi:hypothetical protein
VISNHAKVTISLITLEILLTTISKAIRATLVAAS